MLMLNLNLAYDFPSPTSAVGVLTKYKLSLSLEALLKFLLFQVFNLTLLLEVHSLFIHLHEATTILFVHLSHKTSILKVMLESVSHVSERDLIIDEINKLQVLESVWCLC